MANLQDFAELLVAAWRLSGDTPQVPTSHGLHDRALAAALDKGAFPSWQRELHFAQSRVGLQCVELGDVLTRAQRAEFTAVSNPSYQTTTIRISQNAARHLLRRHGVLPETAAEWGRLLRKEVEQASKEHD